MGGNSHSISNSISDVNGRSKKAVRSGVDSHEDRERLQRSFTHRYGLSRATASRAVPRSDDEVELTRAPRARDGYSNGDLSCRDHSLGVGGGSGCIMVDTEVRVSMEEGTL